MLPNSSQIVRFAVAVGLLSLAAISLLTPLGVAGTADAPGTAAVADGVDAGHAHVAQSNVRYRPGGAAVHARVTAPMAQPAGAGNEGGNSGGGGSGGSGGGGSGGGGRDRSSANSGGTDRSQSEGQGRDQSQGQDQDQSQGQDQGQSENADVRGTPQEDAGSGEQGPSGDASDRASRVTSRAEGVDRGDRVAMDTATRETVDDRVAVDSIAFTAETDADAVTVTVTQGVDPTDESPAFDREDGTEAGGYVHVDHSVANEDVDDVTVTFRVHEDRLDAGERPDDVALYRHEADGWRELPTEQVDRTADHYVFEAESPGLSNFVTGVKKPKFEIADAQVSVSEVRVAEGTEVVTRVTNVGGSDGTFVLKLYQDDERVAAEAVSIAAEGTRQTTFDRTFEEPGVYQLYVNERFAGNVTVTPVETATPAAADATASPAPSPSLTATPTAATSTPETTPGSAPGFGPLTALVAVTLLLAGAWRRVA